MTNKLLSPDHAVVKLDFTNSVNSIRQDLLDVVAKNTPELYYFTLSSYSCELTLLYSDRIILGREGTQQGDQLSYLEFCEVI